MKTGATPEQLYLDLLQKCLTRCAFPEPYETVKAPEGPVGEWLASQRLELVRRAQFDPKLREEGRDWPAAAETMIGLRRLDNLHFCIADVLRRRVPGDLIETGVWRGGASIFMRAVLKAYNDTERVVWLADSFAGLPKPNPAVYPADAGDLLWTHTILAVSLEEVKENFTRYGLLDDQVRFLAGWFRDTLPNAPIGSLAVLRLDGDLYESTMDALRFLYPKLSVGGYAIVDDYGAMAACRAAVDDFRAEHGITEELQQIDWTGVFWKRLRGSGAVVV